MRNYLLAWRIGIAAVALFAFGAPGRAELDFQFEFDATPDDGVTPPIVGTGMLELATDPGDGTFAYGALSPTYTFSFDTGDTFTQADLASDPGRVLLVISSVPGGRRIQFTDTGTGGGGPAGGSLDLVNMAGVPGYRVLFG